MKCNETQYLIHAFLDEDIDELSNHRLQTHLQTCSDCRIYFRELQKAIAFVQSASHVHAPSDFTARVMSNLPPQKRMRRFSRWITKNPFLTSAAVFFILMSASLMTTWFGDNDTLQVSSSNLENLDKLKIDHKRNVVVVPAGTTVSGDLIVRNGSVEVQGEVTGNVVAIDGKVFLASTAHVAGDAESIEMIFDWIWYELKNIGNDLLPSSP